jgi:DNA-directed RNA polymerase-3 subunit RPC5
MADIDMNLDHDPIKASYDIYIKPCISEGRQIYVLQFPNRDSKQRYSEHNQSQPLKMRIKPEAGMVELDVPMDAWSNYDRGKGLKWGEAVAKSSVNKGGGSHGLPGGFGIGGGGGGAGGAGRGRGRGAEDEYLMQQRILADYANAVKREQVLVKQTLGGQAVPVEETTPQYMIGTFRQSRRPVLVAFQDFINILSDQLHLTPVDKIVQMRPQFHHIDAHSEIERAGRARDPALGGRMQEARAVHMTVKSNVDGEEDTTDSMAKRITAAQTELWKTHRYIDEDTEEAWAEYKESMFVGTDLGTRDSEDLLKSLPKLLSSLNNKEYLDTISAPRNALKLTRKRIKKEKVDKGKQVAGEEGEEGFEAEEEDTFSSLSDHPSDMDLEDDDEL